MNKQEQSEYWERMTKYLSNELNSEERHLFEEWAQKADNKNLLNEMSTDINHLNDADYLFNKSTDQAWKELHSRIEQDEATKNPTEKYPLFKTLYRVAATLIIILGLSWAISELLNNNNILTTEYAQTEMTLCDGSIVSLNANSKLIYPKSFDDGDTRSVELIGEAYFDISPNPDKPFIITANKAEIKVLGTRFNVIANLETDKVEVLVESGIVSLSSKNNAENSLLLEKGELGILEKDILFESEISNPNYLSWKTKVMDFRDENLYTVLEVINHTYGVNIVLDSEPLNDLKLTSKYDNINLDTLLQSICIAFDLKKSEINNQIILSN